MTGAIVVATKAAQKKRRTKMETFALRGHGPRVFISYSFQDATLAEQISRLLSDRGFQVHREDETSLANQVLTEAIPRRIAEAEVLIQVLTATSNASEWVARELAYATELRQQHNRIVILPIVFHKASLSDAVKAWWYLDIEASGLTDEAISQIERVCLSSVHLLPLAAADPLSFDETNAISLLRELPVDGKRVIVDSGGRLLRWAQDTLDYCQNMDSPHRDALLTQEQKRMERLIRRYQVHDEVVRKLVKEIMDRVQTYSAPGERLATGLVPLQRYARIVIGEDMMRAAEVAPPGSHPLRVEFQERIEAARNANSRGQSRGYHNRGFYAWVFGEQDGDESMVTMGMDAPGFKTIKVAIPRHVFGTMADVYTRNAIEFDPNGELFAGTFINYILPQIAVTASFNLPEPKRAREDLEMQYAWQLQQYTKMGIV
jgi:hypothetical protein